MLIHGNVLPRVAARALWFVIGSPEDVATSGDHETGDSYRLPLITPPVEDLLYPVVTHYPDPSDPDCIRPIPRTLDVFDGNFQGAPEGIVTVITDELEFELLTIFRTDLRNSFPAEGRLPMEVLSQLYLPYEARDPVAVAIGEAPSIPTVSGHASYEEHAIAILYDDGLIRFVSPEDSSQSVGLRDWPATYQHDATSNVLAAPALPAGVTEREYCDIAILDNGDLIVSVAQDPLVSSSKGNVLREGLLWYDQSAAAWKPVQTGWVTVDFLHPQAGGSFSRNACMSVDAVHGSTSDFLVSTNHVTGLSPANGKWVWRMRTGTSSLLVNWFGSVRALAQYENVEGVAHLDSTAFAVLRDFGGGGDPVVTYEVNSFGAHHYQERSSSTREHTTLAAVQVATTDGCGRSVLLTSWGHGGGDCATMSAYVVEECP